MSAPIDPGWLEALAVGVCSGVGSSSTRRGNYRKHCAEAGRSLPPRWVDPCSSARQLDGWHQPVRLEPGVVQRPRSWLLAIGWKRHGLLNAHEIPSRAD